MYIKLRGLFVFFIHSAAASSPSEKEVGKTSVSQILETLEYGPAPESPAVVNAWLDDHGRSFGHFINNQWVKPSGRKTYDSVNPATGEKLATTVQGMKQLKQSFYYMCAFGLPILY